MREPASDKFVPATNYFFVDVPQLIMESGYFSNSRDDNADILAVGDWGQRLSFYTLSGKQVKHL